MNQDYNYKEETTESLLWKLGEDKDTEALTELTIRLHGEVFNLVNSFDVAQKEANHYEHEKAMERVLCECEYQESTTEEELVPESIHSLLCDWIDVATSYNFNPKRELMNKEWIGIVFEIRQRTLIQDFELYGFRDSTDLQTSSSMVLLTTLRKIMDRIIARSQVRHANEVTGELMKAIVMGEDTTAYEEKLGAVDRYLEFVSNMKEDAQDIVNELVLREAIREVQEEKEVLGGEHV